MVSLVELIEKRDSYTAGHSLRVANYCKIIAEKMNYSKDQCELIYEAGTLHDIGKIGIPDTVLQNLESSLTKNIILLNSMLM